MKTIKLVQTTENPIITRSHLWFFRFEEAFITLHLKGLKQPLWIGLNDKYRPRTYYWSDNSPSDYFKWHKGEPSLWSGGSDCVEILPYRWAAGKWKTNYCSSKNGFICKKGKVKIFHSLIIKAVNYIHNSHTIYACNSKLLIPHFSRSKDNSTTT